MWLARWRLLLAGLALQLLASTAVERQAECQNCGAGNALGSFEEFLKPDAEDAQFTSDVNVMWSTHVEVIPVTTDLGGWEKPAFHEKLAEEAVRGWRSFQKAASELPEQHQLRQQSANDAFFTWQQDLFQLEGQVEESWKEPAQRKEHGHPRQNASSSWPEMNGLQEYQRLRHIVDKMSRRYLVRSGLPKEQAKALNYSIFNWAAVHGPGELHGPNTHVGEYHVAVFYAQVGNHGGKLRFNDPRGHSPPFGRSFSHTPRSGDLILFPAWLSHMATHSPVASIKREGDSEDPPRVIFSFTVGPAEGSLPCSQWWSDPTGDMRFMRKMKLDPKALGL